VARTHERLATVALRNQDRDQAAKRYQEALKIYEELVQIEPNNMTWRAGYALALARAGKVAEASKTAAELSRRCPQSQQPIRSIAHLHLNI
jgi:tetratricopeptide (TPR) repeat protein